jgi:hypothetical protein
MRSAPLRLMLFDRTCTGPRLRPGLSHAWWSGGQLYGRLLGRLHAWHGASTWADALAWVAQHQPDRPIAELQFWGHGKWGQAYINREILDAGALRPGTRCTPRSLAIRERLVGPAALWWFRTCETFGAAPGQDFARRLTDFIGCRAAGHTYIIGGWQSGLHSLAPGESHLVAARGPQGRPARGPARGAVVAPPRAQHDPLPLGHRSPRATKGPAALICRCSAETIGCARCSARSASRTTSRCAT